jgi:hypothetical protein
MWQNQLQLRINRQAINIRLGNALFGNLTAFLINFYVSKHYALSPGKQLQNFRTSVIHTFIFRRKQSQETGCICRHGVRLRGQYDFLSIDTKRKHSRTTFIQINWDGETSGYPENPDNWIFL